MESAQISGSGMLNTPSVEDWFAWFFSKNTKNIPVKLNNVTLANGGGHWAGAFHCTASR